MTKASGQSGSFLRRKFFSPSKENISCRILFPYVRGEAPEFVLNYRTALDRRCVSSQHGEIKGNLDRTCLGLGMEMLFH
ncbi:hypothetical protein [Agrobacterium genomosp. 13]|uniref:hypothetical protein n=1 Tax=Agrobacterium genomosp. 13 TaxID=1183419 RepID=UPI00111AA857|nr:hypothetical protein [Agrobacterium genomosp. 13]